LSFFFEVGLLLWIANPTGNGVVDGRRGRISVCVTSFKTVNWIIGVKLPLKWSIMGSKNVLLINIVFVGKIAWTPLLLKKNGQKKKTERLSIFKRRLETNGLR